MPIQAGDGKTAVALFVDGLELKFVRLSSKGGKVTLRDFLDSRFGEEVRREAGS